MKRTSTPLEVQIRQPDGSLQPLKLMLHPPNAKILNDLAARGILEEFNTASPSRTVRLFLEIFAAILSRMDKEHGTVEWVESNLEDDDIPLVIKATTEMMGMTERKEESLPNAVSP